MTPLDDQLPSGDVERLRTRVRRLAEEKSYLQLIIRLIEQLNPLPGLEDMVRALLHSIVETLGGTNIRLYYWVEGELHYTDFLAGGDQVLADYDDPMVAESARRREFVETETPIENALLREGVLPGAWTWAFPLLVGQELIGVIKLENIHVSAAPLRNFLPLFFSHTALLLSNEIRNDGRRRDQEALRESENRLATILDNVSAYIYLKDSRGRYLYANRPVRELFQAEMNDIVGQDDSRFFDAESSRKLWDNDRRVIDQGETIRLEETNIDVHDGTAHTYWSVKLPLRRENGEIYALCGISTDITERKQAEAALMQYNDRLEAEVRQRTAELIQARDQAESANRMKSVFLANMSHELRTPLNAILGFAQLMARDDRIPEDERRNLATINKSGHHLLGLINDVLEISRIEAGKLSVTLETVDLADLLDNLVDVMALRAESKGLALHLRRAPELPGFIRCDLSKLRQVLLNLLSNAVKYTEQGEVVLRAAPTGAQLDGADGARRIPLLFEVHDTGVGIEAADLDKIFQPFYQTEHGVRGGEGTGLGLTICREYAVLLGGSLTVESTPGVGSTFRFLLPAEIAPPPLPEHPANGRVVGLAADQPAYRVLVAEDQSDNQRLIAELLKQVGFQARVAGNGREAVEQFIAWRPHFIWMDMRMPVMDGFEATRAIRALPGGDRVPIVALTASAFLEEHQAILAAGCDEIMKKPILQEPFFELMARLLHARFEYAGAPGDETPMRAGELSLAGLPDALLDGLRVASEALDTDAVEAAIAALRAEHPEQAQGLAQLAAGYEFDRILRLCREASAHDGFLG